jgi:hypothetical protein
MTVKFNGAFGLWKKYVMTKNMVHVWMVANFLA